MKAETVTIGVPVRDLVSATAWYRSAFELGEPDQIPMDGLVEWDLGTFWLQLAAAPASAGGEGISVNISIESAATQHRSFAERGLTVTDLQRFEGVVEYFELTDPDGNTIGFVTELG